MINLNKEALTQEKRYGVIEFNIDTLFDISELKNYVIPLIIYIKDGTYQLNCLSPNFDSIGEFDMFPFYTVTLERTIDGEITVKEIKKQ